MIRAILLTVAAMVLRQQQATLAPVPGQHQFGNVVYTLPPGWTPGRNSDGVQIILSDLPDDLCEYCYIYVSAGFPAQGSLTDFIMLHQGDFADDAEEAESISVTSPPAPLTASGRDAVMMGVKLGSVVQVIVAYDLGARYELLAFESYAYDDADLTEGLQVLSDQISPMLDNLQFVSAGAPSLLPMPLPGRLNGLYWGTSLEQSFGLDMMMRYDIATHSLFFWPDGQFYDGTPPDGLQPLDRNALMARGDARFGVYRQQGNLVLLTYATGEIRELTQDGAALTYDDISLSLTPLMPDGTRIDGTIASVFYSGFTPGAGIDGGISASSETTFFADGSYSGESFGGASGSFDLGGGFSTGSSDATGGRYEVRDGLIVLTPADGSAPNGRIIVNTSEGIMIGGQFLD